MSWQLLSLLFIGETIHCFLDLILYSQFNDFFIWYNADNSMYQILYYSRIVYVLLYLLLSLGEFNIT